MLNFSPVFGFTRICPNFCSPWFWKHFTVLQSWTKLLEKTKHEQNKNHLLASLSHSLPLCNDNRTQTAKKPLNYCFSLRNSTTVTSPPPPLPLMQCWCGKWCLLGNCSWPKRQHWVGGRGGGFGSLLVYKWTRLEGKFSYRFCPRQTHCFPNYR